MPAMSGASQQFVEIRLVSARFLSIVLVRFFIGSPSRANGALKTCEELGIGFVPWGPVGMGYLPGKMGASAKFDPKTDLRSGFDRFSPANLTENRAVVNLRHPPSNCRASDIPRSKRR